MRPPTLLTRCIAALLMAGQLQACAPTWQGTARVTPHDAVEGWRPSTVRLHLVDGAVVTVIEPRVIGDSIVGQTLLRTQHVRVAFARADVAVLGWDRDALVVVSSPRDTVKLTDVWETPDSVGGRLSVPGRSERRAIALTEVTRLELRAIPRTTVARGERLRIRYGTQGHSVIAEGLFERTDRDTLVLWQERGAFTRIAVHDITHAEAQISTTSNVRTGVLIGLVSAAVILGVGAIWYGSVEEDPDDSGCCGAAVILWGAMILAAVPLVLAPAAGVASRHASWESVSLQALRGGSGTTAPATVPQR